MSPLEKWEHVELFETEQHFELATTLAVHALIEVEYPTMGAEVVAAITLLWLDTQIQTKQNSLQWKSTKYGTPH